MLMVIDTIMDHYDNLVGCDFIALTPKHVFSRDLRDVFRAMCWGVLKHSRHAVLPTERRFRPLGVCWISGFG